MKEVKAKTGFDHDGNRVRGSRFTVSDKHALELEKKGLVEILGDESVTPPAPGAVAEDSTPPAPPAPPLTDAQKFVAGTGAEIAAAIPGADKALLIAALAAEKEKGDDARKGVMEALTKATAD
jgi:hypothetical protein